MNFKVPRRLSSLNRKCGSHWIATGGGGGGGAHGSQSKGIARRLRGKRGKPKKIDMPIMSEVGRSSLAFKSLGKWRQLPLYCVLPCLLSLNLSPPLFFFFFLKIFQSLSSCMATASSLWALWD